MANSTGTAGISPVSVLGCGTSPGDRRLLVRAANVREAAVFRRSLGDLLVAVDATGYCSIETVPPARGRRGWSLYLHIDSPDPDGEAVAGWLRVHREVVNDLISRYIAARYAGEGVRHQQRSGGSANTSMK